MHIEKNFFDNIFNIVMNVSGKTKDNDKARKNLFLYCDRKDLQLKPQSNGRLLKPKANYTFIKDESDITVVRRSNYHYFSNFSIASL